MHSHRRSRGKVLFEALCALGLAASFAGAWDQTGAQALLASASITALFAIYWSFGLFARDRARHAEQPSAVIADTPEVEAETTEREEVFEREQVVAAEPEVPAEPEPVAKAPKKPRARKARKAAAQVAPVVEQAEPAAFGDSTLHALPLEPLFEPQPFVRQPRAFGRRPRGPRTLPAA